MATVAEQLRAGREAKQLTVNQVAEVTKVRTDHGRALEEGNYDAFSAPVYIRGFVRTYANLLKLDVGAIMADLDAELGRTEKFAEPPPLTDHSKGVVDFITLQLSKMNWRIAGALSAVVVIFLAIYFGNAFLRSRHRSNPLNNIPPATYQPTSPGGERAPLPNPSGHR